MVRALNGVQVDRGLHASSSPFNHGFKRVNRQHTPNHFNVQNPTSGTSWSEGINNTISETLKSTAELEGSFASGIFGDPSFDPYQARHSMYVNHALLAKMYSLIPYAGEITKANRAAEKESHNNALAA